MWATHRCLLQRVLLEPVSLPWWGWVTWGEPVATCSRQSALTRMGNAGVEGDTRLAAMGM